MPPSGIRPPPPKIPRPTTPEHRVPERTCVGCRTRRPASELIRFVRQQDATVAQGRTLPGRGAWLCRASPSCLDQAIRKGGFARAFRAPVSAENLAALRAGLDPDTQ